MGDVATSANSDEANVLAWLEEKGHLGPGDAARGRETARAAREPLLATITRLGLVTEERLTDAYAAVLGLGRIEPKDFPAVPVACAALTPDYLAANRILPLGRDGRFLDVAAADPLAPGLRDNLRFATGLSPRLHVAAPRAIEEAIARLYQGGDGRLAALTRAVEGPALRAQAKDVARVREAASEAPVIRFVAALIERAVEARASDIHFEPFEQGLRIRFRIDGDLREIERAAPHASDAIQSRIKIMSGLNIAERRLPQDGRMRLSVRGEVIDFRVAATPTVHGEAIVIRVLDPAAARLDDRELGFAPDMVARFRALLDRPNGIVLVTGPTGSGKTTTLYAALHYLNTGRRKILTVEDPVEYLLDGINQTHVRADIGHGFAAALRSFLRQDPDVMMVGEIRDRETAETAVRAALTGHLVLSTLHTNDAPGAITRLLDMGIEGFLVASTVNGILAQRLVKRLCPHCRREVPLPPAIAQRVARQIAEGNIRRLYAPGGCAACERGWKGRLAIGELLVLDDALAALAMRGISSRTLAEAARGQGFRPMLADGFAKAAAGETTLEEVLRATPETSL